jgi:hypothetical protein
MAKTLVLEETEVQLLDELISEWLDSHEDDGELAVGKLQAVVAVRGKLAEAPEARVLFDKLWPHLGHDGVCIATYGGDAAPENLSLECEDENEVICDTDVWDVEGRGLWEILEPHIGHNVGIIGAASPDSKPASLSVLCFECDGTLLDTDQDELAPAPEAEEQSV